jgi:REP element-mobilizing transposase RayT
LVGKLFKRSSRWVCAARTLVSALDADCQTSIPRANAFCHMASGWKFALSLFPSAGKNSDGKVFVWMDRYLDTARKGPQYLLRPEIAAIVAGSIRRGVSLGHYELRAWVVMANHVQVLLAPLISQSRLLQSLKGHTAREANLVLNRTGQKFWEAESYGHWSGSGLQHTSKVTRSSRIGG